MIVQLFVSAILLCLLLLGLMVFYIKRPAKLPYYIFSPQDCVDFLTKAVNGELLECEWYAFIEMAVRGDAELEELRKSCLFIEEYCVKRTHLLHNRECLTFDKEAMSQLRKLLDEWRHKASYVA